jgi:hypothetical protein
MRRATVPIVSSFLLAQTLPAAAQVPPRASNPTDAPLAADLFVQGRAAMADKNYQAACPKFAESFRLDPHVGSLMSLAQCEEAMGRLALARTHWLEAVEFARRSQDQREAFAAEQLARIEPSVPRLTLRRAANCPADAVVKKDDVEVGALGLDVPLRVEVGDHRLTIEAPGFAPRTLLVHVEEGESKSIDLELGAALPPPPPAPPLVPPPPPQSSAQKAATPPAPDASRPLRPYAVATAGVGVVALGFASFFGIEAILAKNDPPADTARNFALAEGDASTVLFLAGGALVTAGVVMWFVAPKKETRTAWWVAPSVGGRSTALNVEGSF